MLNKDMIFQLYDRLKAERGVWESHWQELAEYFLPQKATITKIRTSGEKINTNKYDGTPIKSLQIFMALFYGYLTNPSSLWLKLKLRNKEKSAIHEVKIWLKECEEIVFETLGNSNFYDKISEVYMNFGCFGVPILYIQEDIKDVVRFFVRSLSEVCIMENANEIVDTAFRKFKYSTRQAFEMWGKRAGEKVLKDYESGKYENMHDFLHCVMPRYEIDVSKRDAINKPFASIYYTFEKREVISESGYDEFPYFTPRNLQISGDPYAYSQCAMALASCKTLNAMKKTMLKLGQKKCDPPYSLPNNSYILPIRMTPGAGNIKMSDNPNDKLEFFEIKGDVNFSLELQQAEKEQIKEMLFVDLFLILASVPNMTATEVRERINEKMLLAGPVIGKILKEGISPLVVTTFNILFRNGKLPPMPEILEGEEYEVEYVSPLAKAQKLTNAQAINDFMMSIININQVDPSIIDNINSDNIAKELGDVYNVPQNILRSEDEVRELRENRARMMEEQRQTQETIESATAIKDVASAEKMLKESKK